MKKNGILIKPSLGPVLMLDRERCIACARCTRFGDIIAGDHALEFIDRGYKTEVGTPDGGPAESKFIGNTIMICPVGALTSNVYRFRARPWDNDHTRAPVHYVLWDAVMILRFTRWRNHAHAFSRKSETSMIFGCAIRDGLDMNLYYDYYQPEAYIPSTDTFIEKDSSINDEIDKLRHSATSSLFERKDVIIVASVSCIYGLGSPEEYREMVLSLRVGMEIDRNAIAA